MSKLALVQLMAECWIGDNPLFETFMAKFIDAYAPLSLSEFIQTQITLQSVLL